MCAFRVQFLPFSTSAPTGRPVGMLCHLNADLSCRRLGVFPRTPLEEISVVQIAHIVPQSRLTVIRSEPSIRF
jgi:hypothetical protein